MKKSGKGQFSPQGARTFLSGFFTVCKTCEEVDHRKKLEAYPAMNSRLECQDLPFEKLAVALNGHGRFGTPPIMKYLAGAVRHPPRLVDFHAKKYYRATGNRGKVRQESLWVFLIFSAAKREPTPPLLS
jgi:hypothetical protein